MSGKQEQVEARTLSGVPVEEGSRWRRRPPGREVVEIRRVFTWSDGVETVRAHPVRGGKPLVAPVSYIQENFEEADR